MFVEREENVKADIFHAYITLLKQTKPSTIQDSDSMELEEGYFFHYSITYMLIGVMLVIFSDLHLLLSYCHWIRHGMARHAIRRCMVPYCLNST